MERASPWQGDALPLSYARSYYAYSNVRFQAVRDRRRYMT